VADLPLETALPQHPQIRVWMNQSHAARYEDYRGMRRYGDDLEAKLIEEIDRARSTLDAAVHELDLPAVARALAAAHGRGVRVRVLREGDYRHDFARVIDPARLPATARARYDRWLRFVDADGDGKTSLAELETRDAEWILAHSGIPSRDDGGSGTMHHKFLVIDTQRVVTGSVNFTLSDMHGDPDDERTLGNVNHLLAIDSRELAAAYTEEFALLWGGRTGRDKPVRPLRTVMVGDARVGVLFGPQSGIDALIAEQLARAQRRIDFALFVFSDPSLAAAVGRAAGRGVQVRGVLDPGFAYRPYSASFDLWGLRRCSGSPAVLTRGVGIARLPRHDKLHHKFALVDGRTVLTGSHNWSSAAEERNDENFLAITHPAVSAHFAGEFARLHARALLGPPRRRPENLPCRGA